MKARSLSGVLRSVPLIGLLAVQVIMSPPAHAAAGDLDPAFGSGGKVTTDFAIDGYSDDDGAGMALQPGGKIVVAGTSFFALPNPPGGGGSDITLARYGSNGSLDPSFGTGGKVTTEVGSLNNRGAAVVLQPDGKILVAGIRWVDSGFNYWDWALVRYDANGSLDTTFGVAGSVTTDFAGGSDYAMAMALQPDGKIVVSGSAETIPGDFVSRDFGLARYKPDGSLDTTFGTGGLVTTSFGGNEGASAVAIQTDGKIVAGGGTLGGDFDLARYNTDGSLDTTFGTGGTLTTDFGGSDSVASIAIQTDGKIVAAGSSFSGPPTAWTFDLARYTTAGSLDPSFGTGGRVISGFGGAFQTANSVAIQPDGKIVAGGKAGSSAAGLDFAIARYNGNGSPDASFGVGGKITTDFAGDTDAIAAVALQGDGNIVAAGTRLSTQGEDFAVARYQGNPPYVPPSPQISGFAPRSGRVGATVTIVGTNLQGTTSLTFNTTSQPSFSVDGTGTVITATVPAGATSGPIRVWTPFGSAASVDSFVVTSPSAHVRGVTLNLWGHLRLSGTVATQDAYAACFQGASVEIQRQRWFGWHAVSTLVADAFGMFHGTIPDRTGTYRANVQATTLSNGDTCSRAVSRRRHHGG